MIVGDGAPVGLAVDGAADGRARLKVDRPRHLLVRLHLERLAAEVYAPGRHNHEDRLADPHVRALEGAVGAVEFVPERHAVVDFEDHKLELLHRGAVGFAVDEASHSAELSGREDEVHVVGAACDVAPRDLSPTAAF